MLCFALQDVSWKNTVAWEAQHKRGCINLMTVLRDMGFGTNWLPTRLEADPTTLYPGWPSGPNENQTASTFTVSLMDVHKHGWHSTGLYAAPGANVTVTAPQSVLDAGGQVLIAHQKDDITQANYPWKRHPKVSTSKKFGSDSTVTLATSYGGGIVLVAPASIAAAGTDVQVTVTNAHRAPVFIKGVTTAQEWDATIRNFPGNFGEIFGQLTAWAVPSSYLRTRTGAQILASLDYWDTALQHCYDFAALTAAEVASRPRQWFVFDIDLGWCAGHSGNPIAYMMPHNEPANPLSPDYMLSNEKNPTILPFSLPLVLSPCRSCFPFASFRFSLAGSLSRCRCGDEQEVARGLVPRSGPQPTGARVVRFL